MFNPYVVPLVVEGEGFAFYVGNEEGKAWYDTPESSRRAEMRFIREHLVTSGGLVVECGCHHGLTTILLSKWVGPHGKVLAFEANANNAAIALENVALNGLTNVEILVAAVGNVTGTLFLTGEFNSSVCSASVPGSTEVAAIRLDDFLGGRIPDLAKIDVEGYETEVLRGFRSTLAPGRSNLAIEVHTQELVSYGSSSTELFELPRHLAAHAG